MALRLGVVGCADIFKFAHGPALSRMSDVFQLAAFCDIDAEKLAAFGKKYGVAELYTDYNEMYAKAGLDAVLVATPTSGHCQPVVAALNAKLDTLCEKPMAMTLEECRTMLHAARDNRRMLDLCFMSRYAPAWMKVRELVKKGIIGDLISCTMTQYWDSGLELYKNWRTRPEVSGGGIIADSSAHWIDIMRFIVGEITAVSAALIPAPDSPYKDVDDSALVTFNFDNGAIGLLRNSWRQTRGINSSESFEIFGTHGSIVADLTTPWVDGGIQRVTLWKEGVGTTWEFADPIQRFVNQLQFFADHVHTRQAADTAWDGFQALFVQQEIYRAAKERRWLDIALMEKI